MADQCIVCLEDLDVVPDAIVHDLEIAGPPATTHPGKPANNQPVALIKPCGHVLHNECLREWSQKANSCPICRQTFNLVEVLNKVGGKSPILYLNRISSDRIVCELFFLDLGGFARGL
jgi:Ring finger domain